MNQGLFDIYLERRGCVKCTSAPKCPTCPDGEECTLTTQTCDACAKGICQKKGDSGDSDSSSSVNKGAVAGGVVGGVVVVALIIGFLLWRYVFSAKAKEKIRQKREMEEQEAAEKDYHHGGGRMSSATLSSVNTSATHGSNVIPIAYIPGVTNRENNNTPPVPDINQYNPQNGQTFSADDILRHSRSSIATTNYRGSTAVIDSAMMTAVNVKPNLVDIGEGEQQQAAAGGNNNVQYGSAQAINSQRANAHSIRIGKKANPVGLQKHMISEEPDSKSDSEDDTFHEAGPGPSTNNNNTESGYDLPFVIEQNDTVETKKDSNNNRVSTAYVVDDLPIEAYLYSKNSNNKGDNSSDTNHGNGRSSPFDDRYKVQNQEH